VWEGEVKMMGCGGRDLNRSRGSWVPRGRTIAQCWANVRPQVIVRVWLGTNVRPRAPGEWANDRPMLGERSLPQCLQPY
jgi:hypothetical protein